MRKIILCLALCAISCWGCRKVIDNKLIEIDEFASTYNIIGEKIPLKADVFFPKKVLLLSDTTMAIMGKQDDYGVTILKRSKDSVNLITKLGRIGGGPDDVAFGVMNIQRDVHDSSAGIWVSDTRSIKFHPYNKESKSWEEKPSSIKKLSTKLIPNSGSFVLKDSILLGISTSINNQIFIYSPKNKNFDGYDFYPVKQNPYDALMSKTIYSADVELKPDKSHLVLSYERFKSLCIVSLDSLSKPLFLKFKDSPFPEINVDKNGKLNIETMRDLPVQYIDIFTTDHFIYVLYAGKTVEELENFSQESSQGMSIHVFKWDGTAYCLLNLDQIINCICVDEINNVIYGFDPTVEDNSALYQFPIPENVITIQ
jgi:hypothetical protein